MNVQISEVDGINRPALEAAELRCAGLSLRDHRDWHQYGNRQNECDTVEHMISPAHLLGFELIGIDA